MREPDWSNRLLTMRDIYGPAMEVKTEQEAALFFEKLIDYLMRFHSVHEKTGKPLTREDHIKIQKSNIGYYSGYYDSETMARVQRLFNCAHPIFGRATPTAEEALAAGMKAGKAARNGKKIETVEQPKGLPRATPRSRTIILED